MRNLVILFLLSTILFSQLTEISGYVESEGDGFIIGSPQYFGYNKLRLDLDAYPTDALTIKASISSKLFWGKSEWSFGDFMPVSEELASTTYTISDTTNIDFLYSQLDLEWMHLTIGKQPLSMGGGFVWNPTNIFIQKDLLDPSYELVGINSFRASLPINKSELDIIIQPNDNLESNIYSAFNTNLFNHNLSLVGLQMNQIELNEEFSEESSKVLGLGFSTVGEIFGLGIWSEYLLKSDINFDNPQNEFVIGGDYTFDFQTYVMLEAFHQDNGAEFNTAYNDIDLLNYVAGNTKALAKDYVFGMLKHPLGEYSSISLSGIYNYSDNSYIAIPQVDWNPIDNLDLMVSIFKSVGSEKTEFEVQNIGGRLRMRVYF
ncbi:MAG: hypothetical protein ISR90_06820 [Candidatus Marinimicrobia bacterium]|nr:hypothetical protein [Candidatus Neomarinimicrobiota bacterium]MBL7023743.1 hypothetical protein [Candidatus Neomarinimicrobiota bacterium]MBL7109587.1 hypothetical protein [Candidatus Neomarinimicrobiota bacterium]